jgi:hypothetical protein
MRYKYLLWPALFLFFFSINIYSQVGIGNTNPHESSLLDVHDGNANKGILIPHVNIPSLSNANPISNPAESLLVYNTNTTTGPGFVYWNGVGWQSFGSSSVKIGYEAPSFAQTPSNISNSTGQISSNNIYTYNLTLTKPTLVEINILMSVTISSYNLNNSTNGNAIMYGMFVKIGLIYMQPKAFIVSDFKSYSNSGSNAFSTPTNFTVGGTGYVQLDPGTYDIRVYVGGMGGGSSGYNLIFNASQGGHFKLILHN